MIYLEIPLELIEENMSNKDTRTIMESFGGGFQIILRG